MGHKRDRQIAGIVTIILVVIAIVIIAAILWRAQAIQPFVRQAHSQPIGQVQSGTASKSTIQQLQEDIKQKERATEEQDTRSMTDEHLQRAAENAKMNVKNAKPTPDDLVAPISPKTTTRTGSRNNVQVLVADSRWDILTPKEDTMREYGVTEDEMARLVAQYRKEHAYEVEAAPKTLTFSMERWENATDAMQDSMRNIVVEKRPYEDGLIDQLYKEGEL